jgi:hypothetical protein
MIRGMKVALESIPSLYHGLHSWSLGPLIEEVDELLTTFLAVLSSVN